MSFCPRRTMNDQTTIGEIVAINARSAVKVFGDSQFITLSWVSVALGNRWVSADVTINGIPYAQSFHVPDHITLPLPEIESLYRAEIERLQSL